MDEPILIYYLRDSRDRVRASAFIPELEKRFRVLLLERDAQSRESILQACVEQRPRVLLFEDFPFCLNDDTGFLTWLLASTRSGGAEDPIIISSVMDVLTTCSRTGTTRNPAVTALINKEFDAVLAHSDPRFARLEEFFLPDAPLSTPVHHTGFLTPGPGSRETGPRAASEHRVLVLTGEGRTGSRLFDAAVAAQRLLWDAYRLRMSIVSSFAATAGTQSACLEEARHPLPAGLTLHSTATDLRTELRQASLAVCRCNAAVAREVVASDIPTLFVPSEDDDPSGELERARRLTRLQMSRMLAPDHVNGSSIATAIQQLRDFIPAGSDLQRNGTEMSAAIIHQLAFPGA